MYNYLHDFYDFEATTPQSDNEDLSENDCESFPQATDADGSVTVNKNGAYIHCLTIVGQVEGHYVLPSNTKSTKYEHIIPRLVAVEENDDISGLLIILNTVGGDIEAGLAIAELISGMKKPTVSLILGGSHSIGIPLAVSAKKSFVVPTASMTVHPVRMNGLILGVPQTLVYLNKMEDRVIDFITRNSRVSAERFKEMMLNSKELITDFGTILNGNQAVEEGLIDCVGGLSDALDCLYDMIKK
ncbi:MAG: ATP-dependent Clp protease proteolytic subunit [Clostridia bacterium]|nr:ATP-dependent Clp protease proteolytic subunit [Clostridia bacterium]